MPVSRKAASTEAWSVRAVPGRRPTSSGAPFGSRDHSAWLARAKSAASTSLARIRARRMSLATTNTGRVCHSMCRPKPRKASCSRQTTARSRRRLFLPGLNTMKVNTGPAIICAPSSRPSSGSTPEIRYSPHGCQSGTTVAVMAATSSRLARACRVAAFQRFIGCRRRLEAHSMRAVLAGVEPHERWLHALTGLWHAKKARVQSPDCRPCRGTP
ncbi:hypothetical protein ABB22_15595 [Stenotrophomonas nitritireducens]|uniref:Uncharacterized protein n=1 Tax=Stenotrophomonas nitritireducens TaxID=83617 RepID=A0ABR5NGG0_9GAMM|nr:hypothetical protein ABB22_15595 [Stenotrophomonas nitritireducens]